MKTNKQITFNVLDARFLGINNVFNKEYFEDSICLVLDNNRELYEGVRKNNRTPIHSIVWKAFMLFTDEEIQYEYEDYMCTSTQLKQYFEKFGLNYVDVLADLVEAYTEKRKEALVK